MTGPLPFHSERFELVRRLGEGGMGVVYEARDRSNGELVALKTLRELEPSSLLRFKQEFRVLADVAHPNLVELGELVEEGGQWYFTMELVDGVDFVEFVTGVPSTTTDLRPRLSADAPLGNEGPTPRGSGPATDDATIAVGAKRPRTPETATESESTRLEAPSTGGTSDSWGSLPIQDEPTTGAGPGGEETSAIHLRRRRRRGPLDEARLRPALAQLFDALAELHRRGLVHRDVKPSNILVERDGRVVLLDLGIATHVDPLDQAEDEEGLVVGTASFMAPEQAKGAAPAPSADLYGVGVVLYEALVGALPFRGTPSQILRAKQRTSPPRPIDVDPSVPVDLDALCMDLLDRDPARRPSALEARMRLAEAPRTAPTTLARPIFVGREPELARLAAGFAEAWARRRSVPFVVVGPPGVGKTELVRTALRRATHELEHVLVLRGRCYQQESVPFKAFDGVIDALARELAILPEEALRGVLPREIDDLVRLFPVLGRVPGLERASLAPADAENRAESRGRAFEALRSLLVRLSASRPVILVLDDLQWADAESHVLLRAILALPRRRRSPWSRPRVPSSSPRSMRSRTGPWPGRSPVSRASTCPGSERARRSPSSTRWRAISGPTSSGRWRRSARPPVAIRCWSASSSARPPREGTSEMDPSRRVSMPCSGRASSVSPSTSGGSWLCSPSRGPGRAETSSPTSPG